VTSTLAEAGRWDGVTPDVVVLAAGRGTRLGGSLPKPLTPVGVDGETILARQLRLLAPLVRAGSRVRVVVGHREQELRTALPGVACVRAARYAETNTARSLQVALDALPEDDRGLLWLNGDVVFSPGFADAVVAAVQPGAGELVGVRRGRTADEEVKYRLEAGGCVTALSKAVRGGEGEAIGVNHVGAGGRAALRRALAGCEDGDYFEAALEATIVAGARWQALDLTDHFAVEVDDPADLAAARAHLADAPRAA
jgi:CDP-glycerol glycerophosphotransferase